MPGEPKEDFFIEMPPTLEERKQFAVTPEHWAAARAYYREHQNELIAAASRTRDLGVSHRNPPFKVGCAVLSIEPRLAEGEYGVYNAHNFTPLPTKPRGKDKRCAERNAIDAAENWSTAVVAIVTVSKELNTGDPTKAHDALHPCDDCRTMLREKLEEGFIKEDTIICSANDGDGEMKTEERTVKELLELYK